MKHPRLLAAMVAGLALVLPSRAGDIVKLSNNTLLSDPLSWTGNAVPGPSDVAVWNNVFTSTSLASSLGGTLSWSGIRIADPAVTSNPQIRPTTGATLTLGGSGIDMSAATRDFAIGCNLAVGTAQVWNVASGRVLTVSSGLAGSGITVSRTGAGTLKLTGATTVTTNIALGVGPLQSSPASGTQTLGGMLSGTGAVLKDGAGTLTLSGANSHSGGTTLTAGQLNFGHAAAPGSGTLTLTSGTLDNTSGGAMSLTYNNPQNWTGDFTFVGSSSLDLGGGAVAMSGSRTVTVNANTLTAGGTVSGSGGFTKAGVGTMVLAGNNTYAGPTTVAGGKLVLNGTHSAAGRFSLQGTSTVDLNGTETITGPFSLAIGETSVGSTVVNVSGTLNVHCSDAQDALIGQNLSGANGTLQILNGGVVDVTGVGLRLGNSGGTASPSGTLTLDPGSTMTLDTADAGLGFILGNGAAGAVGTVNLNGGSLTTGRIIRKGTGTGIFNFNGGTLKAGLASASFMTGLSAANIRAGGAKLDTNGFSITIGQPLLHDPALGGAADGGLVLSGGGTLTLTGASTYTGPTTVNAGRLALGTGGSIAASPLIELAAAGNFDGGTTGTILAPGQILTGTGGLFGKITVGAGATLNPGAGVAGGTLTGDADLALVGTCTFLVDKAFTGLTADSVTCNRVNFGGTLTVTATGWALAAGDTIKLFEASTYSGSFATLNLPDVSASGLFWDVSMLAVDGTISLINAVPKPVFNPPGGACFNSQSVSITGLAGTTIHYTTDGSNPLTSPTAVSVTSPVTGVTVPDGTTGFTLRAYASIAGYTNSATTEAYYDIVDTAIWTATTSGTWADGANWFGGLVAQGVGRTADFSTVGLSANATVTLDSSRVIGNLKFGVTSGAFDWSVLAAAGATLTLDAASKPVIQVVNRSATIAAVLAGSQGFEKTGAGTLVLTGANTLGSGPTISGGILCIGAGGTTGTLGSAEVLNNGILEFYRSDTYTIANTVSGTGKIYVKPGGTLTLTGALTAATLRAHEGGSRTVILGGTQPNTINVLETNQDGHCIWVFAKPVGVNAFSGPVLDVGNGYNSTSRVRLESDEQIPNTTRVNLYGTQPYYSGHNYFDLNGHNETVAGVVSTNLWTHVQNGAATPSVLTLAGGDTYGFAGSVNDGSTGTLSIVWSGTGTQTFSGNVIDYTGTTTVNAGRLLLSNNDDTWTTMTTIASGAVVEIYRDNADIYEHRNAFTLNGAGTLMKTGNGTMDMNWDRGGTVAMTSGGLIWVKEGTLRLGYGTLSNWTNNKADLTIETGAIFDLWDNNTTTAGVVVDAINGGGSIARSTYGNTGNLTLGVDGGSGVFSGTISNASGIIHLFKQGAGTQTLSGANTYTGTTTVNAGILLANNPTGSGTGSGAVIVNNTGTLGGTGTVAGAVTAAGSLAPGADGTGTLTTGSTTLTGTYQCQLDGANCDKLAVTGNLDLTGATLVVTALAPPTAGSYVIATYTGTRNGTFATVPSGYTVDYGTPNQIKLVVAAGYASWISTFNLTGSNALPGADPDRDGLANSIEFVLGGNPASGMDVALLPTIALVTNPGGTVPDGNYLRFTYRRTPASIYLNPRMQYDADLVGTWLTAVPGQANVVEVLTTGFYAAPTPADRVEVYVPRTGNEIAGKLFGRLSVTVP